MSTQPCYGLNHASLICPPKLSRVFHNLGLIANCPKTTPRVFCRQLLHCLLCLAQCMCLIEPRQCLSPVCNALLKQHNNAAQTQSHLCPKVVQLSGLFKCQLVTQPHLCPTHACLGKLNHCMSPTFALH